MTSESPAKVDRWLRAHPPPDSHLVETGSGGGASDFGYMYGDLNGIAEERWLKVSVIPHDGGSALRADSQAVWVQQRPASEIVPLDAGVLEVERSRDGGNREQTVVKGMEAKRFAELINDFGVVQPGTTSCTQPGPQVEIKLTFRQNRTPRRLAEARFPWPMSNCDSLEMRIGGKRQPSLQEAWILHRHLHPILPRMRARAAK